MQIMKHFEGVLPDLLTNGSKTYSYPYNYGSPVTVSVMTGHKYEALRLLADAVRGFLHDDAGVEDCFVEDLEVAEGVTVPYVWIFGIPLCFYLETNVVTAGKTVNFLLNTAFPKGKTLKSTAARMTGSLNLTNTSTSNLVKAAPYSFDLVFTGNPETAVCLRMLGPSAAQPDNWHLLLLRGMNLLSGRRATIFNWENFNSTQIVNARYADLGEDGRILIDKYGGVTSMNISTVLATTADDVALSDGKIPLIPLRTKFVEAEGAFVTPLEYGIGRGVAYSSLTQTESRVGGRRFIVTTKTAASDTLTAQMGLGLIEAEQEPEV